MSRARLAADKAYRSATTPSYEVRSADFTAALDEDYLINCTNNNIKVTFPPVPSGEAGRYITVGDYNASVGVYNITITSTQKIHGSDEDFLIAGQNSVVEFVYIDDTVGWKAVEAIGENGMGVTGEALGSVKMWISPINPAGWIEVMGQTEAELAPFPELQAMFPSGLPDMRGKFPAGYTAGGAIAPLLAQAQDGELEEHKHATPVADTGGDLTCVLSSDGVKVGIWGSLPHVDGTTCTNTTSTGFISTGTGPTLTSPTTYDNAGKTFPDNVAVRFIIKAFHSVQNAGLVNVTELVQKVDQVANGNPIGHCKMWPGSNAPTGFVEAAGQATTGMPQEIVDLYGANLPDMRGEFARGWDNGRGVDNGRAIGSAQSQAIQSHNHSRELVNNAADDNVWTGAPRGGGSNNTGLVKGSATGNSGGAETRPRNIAWMYIIYIGS